MTGGSGCNSPTGISFVETFDYPGLVQRIGIYGGSFDPVHLGHLLVTRAALEELQLDRLFLVPAAVSPFKPDRTSAPAAFRLQMLRLALAGSTDCEVDEQEIQRGGISYTIDTLRQYARRFPTARLYYLIGADHVSKLPEWHRAGELAQLAQFVVVPRPGEGSAPFPAPFHGVHLRGFPLAVSSSQIRARRQRGQPVDFLLPPAVAEVVRNNRLYL